MIKDFVNNNTVKLKLTKQYLLLILLSSPYLMSDVTYSIFSLVNLNHIFYSCVLIFMCLLFIGIKSKIELSHSIWLKLFIILTLIILQSVNGIVQGVELTKVLTSFSSCIILLISIIFFLKIPDETQVSLVYYYLQSICVIFIVAECLNLLKSGTSLSILFQNQFPLLLFAWVTLQKIRIKNKKLNLNFGIFYLSVIFFIFSNIFLATGARFQFKIPAVCMLIIISNYLFMNENYITIARKYTRIILFIAFCVLISILCFFYFMHLIDIVLSVRSVSFFQRLFIAQSMISEIYSSLSNLLLGFGMGSSQKSFVYDWYDIETGYLPTHSGLLALFYEVGLIGISLIIILILPKKKKKSKINKGVSINNSKQLLLVFFTVWLVMNIVSIWIVPVQNFYYNASMIFAVLLVTLLYKCNNVKK